MIPTPYNFEPNFTAEEFAKIGQFTLRWSHMDHTIGNCLRRLLEMSPTHATVFIFPLSLDNRMSHIERLTKLTPLDPLPGGLFAELKALVKAMQYIRNSAIHGIVISGVEDEPYFELRSRGRRITKSQLFGCEDLINYTAHVVQGFRWSLGEKESPFSEGWGAHTYALPHRPTVPDWLPDDAKAFPKEDKVLRQSQPHHVAGLNRRGQHGSRF
jgi:hypothetical protein